MASNGLCAVRSSIAGSSERTVRSTRAAEAVAELGSFDTMLTIAEETFHLDDQQTTFYGWIDPYGKGRKPGLTWDLTVCAQAREVNVRKLLPADCDREFDFPVRDLSPIFEFSEIEIKTSDWKGIEGYSTEDCSPFSFYFIDEFGHLAMSTCSLSFLKRQGSVFTVEFCGEGGGEDCGVDFRFQGLFEVRFGGIGMYFLNSEKDPVGAGQRLLERHLPSFRSENCDRARVPKNAPPSMTRQKVVFRPE